MQRLQSYGHIVISPSSSPGELYCATYHGRLARQLGQPLACDALGKELAKETRPLPSCILRLLVARLRSANAPALPPTRYRHFTEEHR